MASGERDVERRIVEQTKDVIMSGLSLRDLLKDKFVSEFDDLGKKMGVDINPAAVVLMSDSKDGKDEPTVIILRHNKKQEVSDKQLKIEVEDQKLLDGVVDVLKKL